MKYSAIISAALAVILGFISFGVAEYLTMTMLRLPGYSPSPQDQYAGLLFFCIGVLSAIFALEAGREPQKPRPSQ